MKAIGRIPFVVLVCSLISCTTAAVRDQRKDYQALLTERNPQRPPPTQEAPELHADSSKVPPIVGREEKEEPLACYADIHTFVRKEAGTDCKTYKAEIAGWARKCVKDCDNAARLAEAVASAQATCAAFCRQKNCPGPRYSPPKECESAACYAGNAACTKDWPLMNYCYLLGATRVWNCVCIEM